MSEDHIRFGDGAAYETMMGVWSGLVGEVFLDWLAQRPNLAWLDVGCGTGAFTQQIVDRCAPAEVRGIDPSEAQLAFARTRPAAGLAVFEQGDAMALPFEDDRFDAAAMSLVVAFVPEPAKGIAEMVRVVRPGGLVCAHMWNAPAGGLPMAAVHAQLREMGIAYRQPPNEWAAHMDRLAGLWSDGGLERIETREITVTRTFELFDDYWTNTLNVGNLDATVAALSPADRDRAKAGTRERLAADADGRVTVSARSNAVKGHVAG